MNPNIRLHAGFLYFLDTRCNICTGREAADYILHWFFNDCMTETGIFKATVPEEMFDRMMTYAGFIKEQEFN